MMIDFGPDFDRCQRKGESLAQIFARGHQSSFLEILGQTYFQF